MCWIQIILIQDGASGPLAQNGASLAPFVLTEHTLVHVHVLCCLHVTHPPLSSFPLLDSHLLTTTPNPPLLRFVICWNLASLLCTVVPERTDTYIHSYIRTGVYEFL